jgi:hypothetical protein
VDVRSNHSDNIGDSDMINSMQNPAPFSVSNYVELDPEEMDAEEPQQR